MPRNSSGTMTAPAGQPAVSGTTISSATFNTLVGDLTAELTDSLSRSGKGGMTAPLRGADGTVAAPAFSYTSEPGTGAYRAGASDYRIALAGVDRVFIGANGLGVGAVPTGTMTLSSPTQPSADFVSSNPAAAAGNKRGFFLYDPGVQLPAPGWVFQSATDAGVFISNALIVQRDGLIRLGTPGTQVQPASIVTAAPANTGWTAGSGDAAPGYWKDASGTVHMKGTATMAGGGTTVAITLPAGFRPKATRTRILATTNNNTKFQPCAIQVDGGINLTAAVAGDIVALDGISFLAEQ